LICTVVQANAYMYCGAGKCVYRPMKLMKDISSKNRIGIRVAIQNSLHPTSNTAVYCLSFFQSAAKSKAIHSIHQFTFEAAAKMTTTTRSAAKKQGQADVRPTETARPGAKHKAGASADSRSSNKRRKGGKKQTKIENTIAGDETKHRQENGASKEGHGNEQRTEKKRPEPKEEGKDETSAVEPQGRGESEAPPSSILEKGIIYFFFRGRVNVDEPSGVSEIARSYILLRPIEKDAKLGSGPIGDAGNSRVCVVPKKTLPQSGRDRWIGFVEKAGASFQQLKDEFLASSEYQTKTAGERHTPAATPAGEGVYAITSTGRESHLAYVLTLPERVGELQREIGLKEKGSFIITTKNPEHPGPANARLPKAPEYPKELLEEFRSLRWVPTQPKHLDYVNTQFLLVGESSGLEKALAPQTEDQKDGRAEPAAEMEKLEEEDMQRMKALREDDSGRIFADLQADAGNYPKLRTTF
ncbi:uncharacterized protein B0T15DRAFT_520321, partial [Chaetomium strumarium]